MALASSGRELVGVAGGGLHDLGARLTAERELIAPAIAAQFGREITINPGGAVVLSNAEQNSISIPSPQRLLVLNMRRQVLRPLLHNFDAILARPIPRQVEALRLLSSYIEWLSEATLSAPEVVRLAVAQIYDLAALTMGATRDAAEIAKGRGLRVARLRAIKTDIAERLTSPDLSEETVAMRQRVSPRYVQMLFEQEGITFSQYVIGQRLVRAYRMLTDIVGRRTALCITAKSGDQVAQSHLSAVRNH